MTATAIVIRPEPDNAVTVERLRQAGVRAIGHPLFVLEPRRWEAPSADDFDAILLGSANAVRLAGEQLGELARLPAITVGERTAQAARDAGLTPAAIGGGGLQALIDRLGDALPNRLLRLTGEDHLPVALPAGHGIETRIVYASQARPLFAAFPARGVVLLHSGEAARHLATELDRLERARGGLALACLAPRIAGLAGSGWNRVAVAGEASEAALLELAREMCQTGAVRGSKTVHDHG